MISLAEKQRSGCAFRLRRQLSALSCALSCPSAEEARGCVSVGWFPRHRCQGEADAPLVTRRRQLSAEG